MNEEKTSLNLESSDIEKTKKEAEEKKIKISLDIYIIFSIICVIIYTAISIFLVVKTGMSLDTLTTCFFAFFGGEVFACAMIKRFKLKENG